MWAQRIVKHLSKTGEPRGEVGSLVVYVFATVYAQDCLKMRKNIKRVSQ